MLGRFWVTRRHKTKLGGVRYGPDPVSLAATSGPSAWLCSSFRHSSALAPQRFHGGCSTEESGSLELWNTQCYSTISNWLVVIRPSYQSGRDRTLSSWTVTT